MVSLTWAIAFLCIGKTFCTWCNIYDITKHQPCCETGLAFADLSNEPNAENFSNSASNIKFLETPKNQTNGQNCSKTALFKITFDKLTPYPCWHWSHNAYCNRRMLKIEMELIKGAKPQWVFGLSDSSTNDGGEGDQATQQNDASFVGTNSDIKMYLSDNYPYFNNPFYTFSNAIGPDVTRLTIYVSNMYIRVMNNQNMDYYYYHTDSFALNNYNDNEIGGRNDDIYLGVNRMVLPATTKKGYGVCKVKLSWRCACDCE